MLPEGYEYAIGLSHRQYEFYSEGPKGRIRKLVIYSATGILNGCATYNLTFGDYDPVKHRILDLVVSDNKDQDKVLVTVAATVLDFIKLGSPDIIMQLLNYLIFKA
jgi:hypothetical protein